MKYASILIKNHDVESRLASFGIIKAELLEVVHQASLARNESVSNDPNNAPGLLAYIYGTRQIREKFLRKGWRIDRTDNIEATLNPKTGMILIYQNTDSACDPENWCRRPGRRLQRAAHVRRGRGRSLLPQRDPD